jgi:hypothetical protein
MADTPPTADGADDGSPPESESVERDEADTDRTCDSPACEQPLPENPVLGAGECYCTWTCASMARNGSADYVANKND